MRSYFIYHIQEEVADFFYGKERRFYHLFHEYMNSSGILNGIIERQISYITKPLPFLDMHRVLHQSMQRGRPFRMEGRSYRTASCSTNHGAELLVEDRYMLLKAWGNYDSETLFFETLRKFDGSLLAIDIEHERYGWIRPLKERKYV